MIKIGLFPLNIVMFPEAMFPLHIFEERYKLLIKECFSTDYEFGIILTKDNKMLDIGCSVIVNNIVNLYSDKKMDIIVQGISRFKIVKLYENEKPYLMADVEPFADDDFGYDIDLLAEVSSLFNSILDDLTLLKVESIDINNIKVKYPSFLIAQKAGLNPIQKQALIEIRSENLRLKTLAGHLRKVQPLIKRAEVISKIVKNDGYLNPEWI